MASAATGSRMCSLVTCGKAVERDLDRLVRVRIAPKHVKKVEKLPPGESDIQWAHNGIAQCHAACWKAAVQSAKKVLSENEKAKKGKSKKKASSSTTAADAEPPTSKRARPGADGSEALTSSAPAPSPGRVFCAELVVDADDTAETTDTQASVREAAEKMVTAIKNSDSIMFFTGAGISTAAGIGDYRGLFGKWNEDDLGVGGGGRTKDGSNDGEDASNDEGDEGIPYEALRPTLTHEAIAWIAKSKPHGKVTVVTQNCDGLHELTGLESDILAPLHGCVYTEVCTNEECRARITRNYYVLDDEGSAYYEKLADAKTAKAKKALGQPLPGTELCPTCSLNHMTRRMCDKCGSPLKDTIINFGDDLEKEIWEIAANASKTAPLRIVLGTSVLVTPAAELVTEVTRRKEIIVCNRQATGADSKATLRVFSDCDKLMEEAMKLLLGSEESYAEWLKTLEEKRKVYDTMRSEQTPSLV